MKFLAAGASPQTHLSEFREAISYTVTRTIADFRTAWPMAIAAMAYPQTLSIFILLDSVIKCLPFESKK